MRRLTLRSLFRRRQAERDLEDEINFHIEGKTAEGIARGLSEIEARRAARIAMAGIERSKEECRDARALHALEETVRTIRFACRGLRRNPAFTAAAVLTLALGIGASTAVFTLIDVAMLKPLPWRDPERLVVVSQNLKFGAKSFENATVSAAHSRAWMQDGRSLEGITLFQQPVRFATIDGGEPLRIRQTNITPGMFEMLGVAPVLGRGFRAAEAEPGQDAVVVLSHNFWRDRMNSDPAAIGRKLIIENRPYEVIGLMPPSFYFPRNNEMNYSFPLADAVDVWVPYVIEERYFKPASEFNHFAIARLAPNVPIEAARAELNRLSQGLLDAAKSPVKASVNLVPIAAAMQARVQDALFLLAAAVGAVLLICCVNVANLIFTRALNRRKEQAVRASLGAGRARLLGEMLAESAVLAAAGGVTGVLAARWLIQAHVLLADAGLPRLEEIAISPRVLAFAAAITILAGLCAAAIPAWRFSNVDPQEGLRQNQAHAADPAARFVRSLLLTAQVALCVILLVAAGLLTRSFTHLIGIDKGFDPQNVVTLFVDLPRGRYEKAELRRVAFQDLFARLNSIPGVAAAGGINQLPMRSEMNINGMLPEGESPRPWTQQVTANYRVATPGYFAAAGIPLHAGRIFNDTDADLDAAVISRNAAETLWPGLDPIGRRLKRNGTDGWIRIVGVVNDVRQTSLDSKPPMIVYRPNEDARGLSIAVRTTLPLATAVEKIRANIRDFDRTCRLGPIQTMEELVAATTAHRRLQTSIVAAFALIALLLASLGIFGVVSYATARRRAEIGLRMALGANVRNVITLVMRQGLAPVAAGGAIGAAGAFAVARAMKSMLFGITPIDMPSFLGSVMLLTIVAALACAIPAMRASRIDPQQSLRTD